MLTQLFETRRQRAKDDGFTLIELLVVVIIIGILAAIALPIFLNQQKAALDASVKSDVRNTVAQVTAWQAQHTTGDTVVDGAGYVADGGKVVASKNGMISVIAQGGTDSGYKVCGYNPGGASYADENHAWGFDSTTGHFSAYASTCSGAVPAGGADPAGGTGNNTTGSGNPTTTDPYANDPGHVTVQPVANLLHYEPQAWYGFGLDSTPQYTGKSGATYVSNNFPALDGWAPVGNASYSGQYQYYDLQLKFYDKNGQRLTGLSVSGCSIYWEVNSKQQMQNYGYSNVTGDEYRASLSCQNGAYVDGYQADGVTLNYLSYTDTANLLSGGYYTFAIPGQDAPAKVLISSDLTRVN